MFAVWCDSCGGHVMYEVPGRWQAEAEYRQHWNRGHEGVYVVEEG